MNNDLNFKYLKKSHNIVLVYIRQFLLDTDYNLQLISAKYYYYQETIIWYSHLHETFFKVVASDQETTLTTF